MAKKTAPKLRIIPLGGLGEIGKNMTVFEYGDDIIVVDCGLASCLGVFVRHREYVIPLIVFTSVPLLFLSGISWPGSAVPEVWKWVSCLFPSTFGIQGFVALNNMGASLGDIRPQLVGLSIQALVYFLAAIAAERWLIGQSAKLPRH